MFYVSKTMELSVVCECHDINRFRIPDTASIDVPLTLHTYYKYLTRKMAIIHTSARILHSKRYRPILCPLLVLMFQHSSSV